MWKIERSDHTGTPLPYGNNDQQLNCPLRRACSCPFAKHSMTLECTRPGLPHFGTCLQLHHCRDWISGRKRPNHLDSPSVTFFTLGDTVGSGHRQEAHNSGFQSVEGAEKLAKYFEETWGVSNQFPAFPLRLVLNPPATWGWSQGPHGKILKSWAGDFCSLKHRDDISVLTRRGSKEYISSQLKTRGE